jgi:hypothetical protein
MSRYQKWPKATTSKKERNWVYKKEKCGRRIKKKNEEYKQN